MKNNILLVAGTIAAMVLVGCGTPRVGPAKTTLDRMKGVEPLVSLEETREGTNTTLKKSMMSPAMGQYKLRMKELEGQTKVGVAQANRPSVYTPAGHTTGYWQGGYGNGGNYYPTHSGYSTPITSYGGGQPTYNPPPHGPNGTGTGAIGGGIVTYGRGQHTYNPPPHGFNGTGTGAIGGGIRTR